MRAARCWIESRHPLAPALTPVPPSVLISNGEIGIDVCFVDDAFRLIAQPAPDVSLRRRLYGRPVQGHALGQSGRHGF
jgi:hypothetical protein